MSDSASELYRSQTECSRTCLCRALRDRQGAPRHRGSRLPQLRPARRLGALTLWPLRMVPGGFVKPAVAEGRLEVLQVYKLLQFVRERDKPEIEKLTRLGVRNLINLTEPAEGSGALHLAALTNDLDTVQFLLNLGANPNVQDKRGRTPAILAAEMGYDGIVALLAQSQADMNLVDHEGKVCVISMWLLFYCLFPTKRHTRCLQVALNSHANVNNVSRAGKPVFLQACEHADECESMCLSILERGADPNATEQATGRTPLMEAARFGAVALVRAILQRGGNPNAIDKKRVHAAHLAAQGGFFEAREGPPQDPHRTPTGPPQSRHSSAAGHLSVTTGLRIVHQPKLSSQQRPVGQRPVGQRPVGQRPVGQRPVGQYPMGHRPVGHRPVGQPPVGSVLWGSVLHCAAADELSSLTVHLQGGPASAENDPPPTYYLLCGGPVGVLTIEEQGNTVIQVLTAYSADFSAVDLNGNTALHLAAGGGYTECCRFLAQRGCQPKLKNLEGLVPRQLAKDNGHKAALKELKKAERLHAKSSKPGADNPVELWALTLHDWSCEHEHILRKAFEMAAEADGPVEAISAGVFVSVLQEHRAPVDHDSLQKVIEEHDKRHEGIINIGDFFKGLKYLQKAFVLSSYAPKNKKKKGGKGGKGKKKGKFVLPLPICTMPPQLMPRREDGGPPDFMIESYQQYTDTSRFNRDRPPTHPVEDDSAWYLEEPEKIYTDINYCIKTGDLESLCLAFSQQVPVDVKDRFYKTPLMTACSSGSYQMAEFLVKLGVRRIRSSVPLLSTAPQYRSSVPLLSTAPQYRPSVPLLSTAPQCRSSVPLLSAAPQYRSSVPLLSTAPQYRSSVPLLSTAPQYRPSVPLLSTAPQWPVLALTQTVGAPQQQVSDYRSSSDVQISSYLRADVNACDQFNWTPLHHACHAGQVDIIDLLVQSGAELNAVALNGATPLMRAIESSRISCVDYLIKAGAKVQAENKKEQNCLDIARQFGDERIVDLVRAKFDSLPKPKDSRKGKGGTQAPKLKPITPVPGKVSPLTPLLPVPVSSKHPPINRLRVLQVAPALPNTVERKVNLKENIITMNPQSSITASADKADIRFLPRTVWGRRLATSAQHMERQVDRRKRLTHEVDFRDFVLPFNQNVMRKTLELGEGVTGIVTEEVFYRVEASPVPPPQTPHPCLYGACSVHWCAVMLEQEGAVPKLSHKVGSMEWSRVSWSAEALRVPHTGTKGRSLTPEPHPHTIIPPPPNSTLGTVQSDQYRSPGTAQPRLVHLSSRRRSVIGHSREHASTALESRGGALHHCVPRSALRLVM
ncbi:hypothetical protein NFI96_013569 [Prochilodus magdalenae]|nr:hypothetical protein NFI96_013569 [Prochilodus magdalenae]